MKRTLISLAAIGSLVVGSLGVAGAAQAATPDEVADWITAAALENLGLTTGSPEFEDAIRDAIQQALEAGLISAAVEEVADDEGDADDVLDETLEEQGTIWDEIKEAWRTGQEEAHAAFTECRDAAEGGANLCAFEFRYAMQVNNIAAFQARHEARLLADADSMTEEELANAEEKLAHHESIAMARLDRAAAHLAKKTATVIEDDIEEATEEALVTIEATSSVKAHADNGKGAGKSHKPDRSDRPAKGNNGKGNPNK
ncbi:MAG TPA: hypothetical protein VFS93_00345 [Terrimesophilobacter sp.]|nr:hypothetical protein [Terrimesophilobacter sp.]